MNEDANPVETVGFWSYVHDDDGAEGGRIIRLAERLRSEYSVLTGDELKIFVDREDLAWGDEWRRRISEALTGTTFFIPIITPRYFRSEECRRELLTFAGHARSLGVTELLLPIAYVEVPNLEDTSDDEAVALIARTQYVTWSALRLVDEDSEAYRKEVHALAKRLMEVAEALESRPVAVPELSAEDDEEPGFVDRIAEAEEALPRWLAATEKLGPITEQITEAMNRTTARAEASDARGKGFAGRVVALRHLALELEPLTTELLETGSAYASEVVNIDSGILTLIRAAETETEGNDEALAAYCELFQAIEEAAEGGREMAASAEEGLEGLRGLQGLSRDLRPPLRKMEDGIRRIVDAQTVIDEWVRVINESPVDCSDVRAANPGDNE